MFILFCLNVRKLLKLTIYLQRIELSIIERSSNTLGSRYWYITDNDTPLSDSLSVQNLSVHMHLLTLTLY